MEIDNCTKCLYSTSSSLSFELMDLIGRDVIKCDNENSPYYNEILNEKYTCRLFVDANERFKMEDRRESILKIKDNLKFNKW